MSRLDSLVDACHKRTLGLDDDNWGMAAGRRGPTLRRRIFGGQRLCIDRRGGRLEDGSNRSRWHGFPLCETHRMPVRRADSPTAYAKLRGRSRVEPLIRVEYRFVP